MDFLSDKNIFDFNFLTFLWNLTHLSLTLPPPVSASVAKGSSLCVCVCMCVWC